MAPLPPAPPGDVGVATTKLVSVCAPPPERLVVMRTRLDDRLCDPLPLGPALPLEPVDLVVMAVLVVERLPLAEPVGETVTVVEIGEVGEPVVVMVVIGSVTLGVLVMETTEVVVPLLLRIAAAASAGKSRNVEGRILE